MAARSGADTATLTVDRGDKKRELRDIGAPSLTVIFTLWGMPTPAKVNAVHTPLEVVHGI